ncbi:hypothetical protein [Alteromonas ponticola]|uniref:SPOR domain-containing protein n=1 Tax=Alteromonas ponticola TaxID=2720613 RepID=A0ABX1R2Y2_9ALTE|nr:hypothetical protein [Alteromonas ponticola]NMH60812.1 hypothetical protein [Alteromonas ponticola]
MFRQVGLALVWLGCFVSHASACELDNSYQALAFSDENLLISVLRVNGRPVNDAFDVYEIEGHLLVPVSLFAGSLDLDWQIDLNKALIYSAYDSESLCEFSIKLNNLAASDGFAWASDPFDLYIDIRLAAALLEGNIGFDNNLLQLSVTSPSLGYPTSAQTVHVPNFSAGSIGEPDRHVADEYRMYTVPLVNYRLTASTGEDIDERYTGNLNANFDLLGHATEYRVSTDGDRTQQYLNFSRYLPTTNERWLDRGISYTVGDVQLQRDELINSTRQSLGAVLYTGNELLRNSFSATTIDALVLPGWRVQLFRNGQFVEERFSENDNRVVFENVETYYGENFFELKLYGPEGQQEIQTRTVNVGRDQIAPGKFDFLMAMTDNAHRLLDGEISSDRDQSATLRTAFGITDATSIFSSFQQLLSEQDTQSYLTMGMHSQINGSLLRFEFSDQHSAGYGSFLGWTGRIQDDTRFNLTGRFFNDFSSDLYAEELAIERELSLRFNGRLDWFDYMGWGVSATHRKYATQDDISSLSLNVNRNVLGGTFSSSLTYTESGTDSLSTQVYYAKQLGDWQLATSFQLTPSDDMRLDDAYLSLRWPQTVTQYRETRLHYSETQPAKLTLRHQHNWRLQPVNLSLAGTVSDNGDWAVNLSVTGDFSYNTAQNTFDFYHSTGGRAARIDAMAFLDENRNNVFDGQDYGLAGVGLTGNTRWRGIRTNEHGQLGVISSQSRQIIGIDPATLPDPFMQPVDNAVEVETHPGSATSVHLPVVTFNDIDGSVYLVKGNASRGASKVTVYLLNDNEVIDTTETEPDGYFYFSNVPPGDYQLAIDENFLNNRQLTVLNLPESITASASGDAIALPDIRLVAASNPDETQMANNLDVDSTPKVSSRPSQRYQIQVGIFRLPRSIFEVLKELSWVPAQLTTFRNHARALTYVTIGDYASMDSALQALAGLRNKPAFSEAFVRPTSYFSGTDWSKEAVFDDVINQVNASHSLVSSASASARYCQLASYRALTSINPSIIRQHPQLVLIRQLVNNRAFYTLLASAANDAEGCSDNFLDHQYRQSPFIVSADKLQKRLLPVVPDELMTDVEPPTNL